MNKHDRIIQELYENFKDTETLHSTDFIVLHWSLGKYIRETYLALEEDYDYFCDYYGVDDENIIFLRIIKDLKDYEITVLQNNLPPQNEG